MKILVTGGTGFIGSHTVCELLDLDYEVVIIDNFSNSKPDVLNKIFEITGKKPKFYEGDVCDKNILNQDVINTIRTNGGRYLTDIKVFDLYQGDKISLDKKSIAYSLTFNSNESTLSDEEVTTIFNKIIAAVTDKFNAILRDK